MEFALNPTKEIVLIADNDRELVSAVYDEYLPNKVVVSGQNNGQQPNIPLLEGRTEIDGQPTVYVCENMVCQRPLTDIAELREILQA